MKVMSSGGGNEFTVGFTSVQVMSQTTCKHTIVTRLEEYRHKKKNKNKNIYIIIFDCDPSHFRKVVREKEGSREVLL